MINYLHKNKNKENKKKTGTELCMNKVISTLNRTNWKRWLFTFSFWNERNEGEKKLTLTTRNSTNLNQHDTIDQTTNNDNEETLMGFNDGDGFFFLLFYFLVLNFIFLLSLLFYLLLHTRMDVMCYSRPELNLVWFLIFLFLVVHVLFFFFIFL